MVWGGWTSGEGGGVRWARSTSRAEARRRQARRQAEKPSETGGDRAVGSKAIEELANNRVYKRQRKLRRFPCTQHDPARHGPGARHSKNADFDLFFSISTVKTVTKPLLFHRTDRLPTRLHPRPSCSFAHFADIAASSPRRSKQQALFKPVQIFDRYTTVIPIPARHGGRSKRARTAWPTPDSGPAQGEHSRARRPRGGPAGCLKATWLE